MQKAIAMFRHSYDYKAAQVLAYRALNLRYDEISKATGLSIVTVHEIIQRSRGGTL
jgi:DNA-directed RNA polymerase specialized sigma24 family protein